MSNRIELRTIRERLFERDPRCHWCQRTTELPEGDCRYVLACARCNIERGHKQRYWPRDRVLAPQLGMWGVEL